MDPGKAISSQRLNKAARVPAPETGLPWEQDAEDALEASAPVAQATRGTSGLVGSRRLWLPVAPPGPSAFLSPRGRDAPELRVAPDQSHRRVDRQERCSRTCLLKAATSGLYSGTPCTARAPLCASCTPVAPRAFRLHDPEERLRASRDPYIPWFQASSSPFRASSAASLTRTPPTLKTLLLTSGPPAQPGSSHPKGTLPTSWNPHGLLPPPAPMAHVWQQSCPVPNMPQTPTMLGSSLLCWGTEIATPHARVCCFSGSLFVQPANFAQKVSPHLCWIMFLLRSAPGMPQLCRMEKGCASTCWGACSPHSASCVYLKEGGVHC
ncbi:uncharacterized protein LOC118655925 [Myotis myotis]|uniref:uncharacterized protein LOC118655925 n=1 Tax=Myotis myotis TaxID=51298 RepID=UPI00174DBA16|nr:uncharacterized protein LOC118655925 [Myotis myotis]